MVLIEYSVMMEKTLEYFIEGNKPEEQEALKTMIKSINSVYMTCLFHTLIHLSISTFKVGLILIL